MLDGANGIDIIGEFPKSASSSFWRERHKPLIGCTKTTQRPRRFYLAVRRYRSDPMPQLSDSTIVVANRHGREGRFDREFRAGEED